LGIFKPIEFIDPQFITLDKATSHALHI